jgi:hypothetical protein
MRLYWRPCAAGAGSGERGAGMQVHDKPPTADWKLTGSRSRQRQPEMPHAAEVYLRSAGCAGCWLSFQHELLHFRV